MEHNIHIFEKGTKTSLVTASRNVQSRDMRAASINYARKETWRTLNDNKSPWAEAVGNKTTPPFCSWRPPLFLREVKDPFECDINQLTEPRLPLCGEIELPLIILSPTLRAMKYYVSAWRTFCAWYVSKSSYFRRYTTLESRITYSDFKCRLFP